MTTSAQPQLDDTVIDPATLVDGARQLATSLGMDGEPEIDLPWPTGEGQRSIVADFVGTSSGSVFLSLADSEVEQLDADIETATGVLAALIASIGVDPSTLESSGFRAADGLPSAHVVLSDGGRTLGFGVTLGESAMVAAPESFDPAPISPTPGSSGSPTAGAPISLLADVDMQVTVELGRTTLPVRELLSLQPGMVVELDRQAGAPIDVLVNGRLIARGEVVVLDEQFGLRITEIVTDGGR